MIDKLQDHLPLDIDLFTPALAAKEIRQLKSKINEIVDYLSEDNINQIYELAKVFDDPYECPSCGSKDRMSCLDGCPDLGDISDEFDDEED